MALAFDPDGTRLAAADSDKETCISGTSGRGRRFGGRRRPRSVAWRSRPTAGGWRRWDMTVRSTWPKRGPGRSCWSSAAPPGPSDNAGFTPRLTFSRDGSRLAANGVFDLSFWEISAPTEPEPPPVPPDVAGWLRQGRALADRGDVAGAEAAYARARELEDGDPSPWIEHALALWRRGDAPQARDALDLAMRSLPDDPERWVDLGRLLGRFGWMQESETALAKARSLAERRLSRAPDDEAAIAALAEALPEVGGWRGWTVLQPDMMASAAGATLTRLPDGSVLAGGLSPLVDTYTVEAMIGLSRDHRTAARGHHRPEPAILRARTVPGDGNFHLEAIRLSTVPELSAPVPVRLSRARADYSDPGHGLQDVSGALDADPTTLWSICPRMGRPHWAVFQAARPIGHGRGMRLRVELDCRLTKYAIHALGRFRLSVTDRPVPFFEPSLMRLKADPVRNGLTRLGAAYFLLGDWAAAASVLERAASGPTPRPSTGSCWPWPAITWAGTPRPGATAIAPSSG